MRKVFWCCLAAGAAACVCCAFWAGAYVSQNPDSAIGRIAQTAGVPASASPSNPTTAQADDLIPPDPVPVEETDAAPPAPPIPASHLPPGVAALIPPIVIHDEEDLGGAKPQAPAAAHVDVEASHQPAVGVVSIQRTVDENRTPGRPSLAPLMPHCTDDDGVAPHMPYCTDDDPAPAAPAGADARFGRGGCGDFDACAFWMGFFTAPTHLFTGASAVPCGGQAAAPNQPACHGAAGTDEAPAPRTTKPTDPTDLFSQPHRPKKSQESEPRSDTMEMRPTDWKPYSLAPGPF